MDFTTIGRVGTYAKLKNLQFAAKHRIKTGQTIANANGRIDFKLLNNGQSKLIDGLSKAKQQGEEATKRRLATIKRKLMNGKKLSNEEMGFLLKNDSKLYNKAKKAEDARMELKSALSRAKSKAEARKAVLHAMMKASSECMAELKAAGSGGGGSTPSGGGYEASLDIGGALGSMATGDGASMAIGGEGSMAVGGDVGSGMANVGGGEGNPQSGNEPALIKINNGINGVEGVGDKNPSVDANNPSAKNLSATNDQSEQSNGINGTQQSNQQTNGINGSQSSSDGKETKSDILEKYIMIIRALQDEWATFMHSKQYKELPEDELSAADDEERRPKVNRSTRASSEGRSEYQALDVISAYRASMSLALTD